MQSQHQRDDKTITIATALVLFVLVLAMGAAVAWAANSAFNVAAQINTAFAIVIWCAAGVIPTVYVVRSVKR